MKFKNFTIFLHPVLKLLKQKKMFIFFSSDRQYRMKRALTVNNMYKSHTPVPLYYDEIVTALKSEPTRMIKLSI